MRKKVIFYLNLELKKNVGFIKDQNGPTAIFNYGQYSFQRFIELIFDNYT